MRARNLIKSVTTKYGYPSYLLQYKTLLEQSHHYTQELLPKKIETPDQFNKFFRINELSHNVIIDTVTPVNAINDTFIDPCHDILRRGGKKWRSIFGLILANYFKLNIETNDPHTARLIYQFVNLPELIHNASLIVDDVEDKSEQRRGEPCTYIKYGEDIAINAGLTMYYAPIFKIIENLDDERKILFTDIYLEEMVAIHLGQGWDIEMDGKRGVPLTSNYIDMVMFKTGVCPRLTVKLLKILVNSKKSQTEKIFKELINLADFMSTAFQIQDDLLNIKTSSLSSGKSIVGEDISNGKQTIMVLHSLNSNSNKKGRLSEILNMQTRDQALIDEAIEIMEVNGSIKYSEDVMEDYSNKVYDVCRMLSDQDSEMYNTFAIDHLEGLMKYLIKRSV